MSWALWVFPRGYSDMAAAAAGAAAASLPATRQVRTRAV